MLIVSGGAGLDLGKGLASVLHLSHVESSFVIYSNHELLLSLDGDIASKSAMVVQSLNFDANNGLMELMLTAKKLKQLGVTKILAIIPYFAYSRQDRGEGARSLVLDLLKSAGINMILTLDVHSKNPQDESKGLFSISAFPLFLSILNSEQKDELLFVLPDEGSFNRLSHLMNNLNFVVMNKVRLPDGKCLVDTDKKCLFKDKKCVIIDDIVDSANTIFAVSELLNNFGAKGIEVCVTHEIFSKAAIKLIEQSCISRLFIANSISSGFDSAKIVPIDVKSFLADWIIANFY